MYKFSRVAKTLAVSIFTLALSSCAFVPQSPHYKGPPERPEGLNQYYDSGAGYGTFSESIRERRDAYTLRHIVIQTTAGEISVDYYQRPESDENLIFVFPVLGGKNILADHFAEYFARHGFDTAIVNRVNDFKDPNRFEELEQIFRQGVIRDRLAIDFFEHEYGKRKFGTFGISRGAINVAITAGVDPRLEYNVMAMGGTDLVDIFRKTDQKGVKRYRNAVMSSRNLSSTQFYMALQDQIKTDPKNLAGYIDSRNTLLMLSLFDRAVPFKYGQKLREQIGNPATVYIASGHYTSVLYTRFLPSLLPEELEAVAILPLPYVESEALSFYKRSFKKRSGLMDVLPFRILQLPLNLVGGLLAN